MKKPKLSEVDNRLGKVLRYVNTYTPGSHHGTHSEAVQPDMVVVSIEWSDLPKTRQQARMALERLRSFGLVARTKAGYKPTEAGQYLEKQANKKGLWDSSGAMIGRYSTTSRRED